MRYQSSHSLLRGEFRGGDDIDREVNIRQGNEDGGIEG